MKPFAEQSRPQEWQDFVFSPSIKHHYEKLKKELNYWSRFPNLLLWGPPGTGKTTFSKLLLKLLEAEPLKFTSKAVNAVDTGAKVLKQIGNEAENQRNLGYKFCFLFIDEIHRLNKAQQDVLLPHMEKGELIIVGATTENPSYEMNSALLSRLRVIEFPAHKEQQLMDILNKALAKIKIDPKSFLSKKSLEYLLSLSGGDARLLLNDLEQLIPFYEENKQFSQEELISILTKKNISPHYDKSGDMHYNIISAFIKSIRGSDADAGLYYLARMIVGGEDPLFIARRLVILASEDIGNADPRALSLAISALQAVKHIGLPEAGINLAQAVTYLASAPKSNRSYIGYKKALELAKSKGTLEVPKSLRSSQNNWSKNQGFGKGYFYSHDGDRGYVKQDFLPQEIKNEKLYEPIDRGFEKTILLYQSWVKKQT